MDMKKSTSLEASHPPKLDLTVSKCNNTCVRILLSKSGGGFFMILQYNQIPAKEKIKLDK